MTKNELRNRFGRVFNRRVTRQGLDILPAWFAPEFPDDTLVRTWRSPALVRGLAFRISSEDEPRVLGVSFDHRGPDRKIHRLTLDVAEPLERVELVVHAYRVWLIDGVSVEDTEAALRAFDVE